MTGLTADKNKHCFGLVAITTVVGYKTIIYYVIMYNYTAVLNSGMATSMKYSPFVFLHTKVIPSLLC